MRVSRYRRLAPSPCQPPTHPPLHTGYLAFEVKHRDSIYLTQSCSTLRSLDLPLSHATPFLCFHGSHDLCHIRQHPSSLPTHDPSAINAGSGLLKECRAQDAGRAVAKALGPSPNAHEPQAPWSISALRGFLIDLPTGGRIAAAVRKTRKSKRVDHGNFAVRGRTSAASGPPSSDFPFQWWSRAHDFIYIVSYQLSLVQSNYSRQIC